jgi:hypothetical protein
MVLINFNCLIWLSLCQTPSILLLKCFTKFFNYLQLNSLLLSYLLLYHLLLNYLLLNYLLLNYLLLNYLLLNSLLLNSLLFYSLLPGVHTCTPLNLSLTGKSTFVHKPRNLKIARLLIEHGANPNLRIPNHDLVKPTLLQNVVTDLNNLGEMIIFESLMTIFEASVTF